MASPVLTNFVSTSSSLPTFDSSGHLPTGIHPGSLSNLARLVRFNEHRRKMWLQLACFLIEPVVKHKFTAAYVAGGFVSTKPEPSDIDLVLETRDAYGPEAFEAVAPYFATGLEKIAQIYGVHLQFWMRGAPSGLTDYLTFFQYDRPAPATHVLSRSRGIVRIDLTDPDTLGRLRRHIRGENTVPVPLSGAAGRSPSPSENGHLRGIKRQLSLLGANAPKLLILLTDSLGRIEWVNETFVCTCGYSLGEVRGLKPGDVLQGPDSDPETVRTLHDAVAEARDCDCQIINYRKDGSPYVVHLMISPLIEEGKHVGFLAIGEDLGEPAGGMAARRAA
jgi:PAS domain S-box-containing protein